MTIATADPPSGLPEAECARCGHIWIRRTARPLYCPLCHKLLPKPRDKGKPPAPEPALV